MVISRLNHKKYTVKVGCDKIYLQMAATKAKYLFFFKIGFFDKSPYSNIKSITIFCINEFTLHIHSWLIT
jgi:hypothetical protein